MDAPQYDLLGPAEKHIAKQLKQGFADSVRPLRELLDKCEMLADIDFEETLLDPKKKESAVHLTEIVGNLPRRVNDLSLIVMIAEVVFVKKEASV